MAKEMKYAILHEDGSLTSKETALDLPNVHIGNIIFEGLTKHGDKPLFADGPNGRVLTAAQLKELVTELALGLLDLGVEQDDVVFASCPNSVDLSAMFLAILSIGATFTACMYSFPKHGFCYRVTESSAKYLISSVKNKDLVLEIADEMHSVKAVIIIDSESDEDSFTPCGKKIVSIQKLINRKSTDTDPLIPVVVKKSPQKSVGVIIYSSGSTGFPKGVLRSHYSLVASMAVPEGHHFVGLPGNIVHCHMPLYHVSGIWTVIQCAVLGNKVIINDGFKTEVFLESVEKHKITFAALTPPYIIILSKSQDIIKKYDVSSLKTICTGAAPLPASIVPKFKSLLGIQRLYQVYGLSESGFATHAPFDVDDFVTCGCPLPLHRLRVIDTSTGKVLGANQVGEIQDQSVEHAMGYLNRPEADKESFFEDQLGRWLKTGDAGYFNEDGLFYIVDRYKEVIKCKGESVAPAELESILLSHDDVGEAVVIGIPDPTLGEIPKAFVVPKDKSNLPSAQKLVKFVDDQVADYMKIRGGIQFIECIPKISVGKPDRVTLKKNPEKLKIL